VKIWTVANQKGGVGKTTSAVALGGLLAQRGERVLLLDLDPHGSLTVYLGLRPEELEDSAYTLFEQGPSTLSITSILQPSGYPGMTLLPSATALATLERRFGASEGMGLVVKNALGKLARRFDHAIIDCPPVLGVLMVNAMVAADLLIIPVQTEFLALKGLEQMLRTLQMIERSRRTPLPWLILPTMVDKRTRASVQSLWALREDYGEHVWRQGIPVDTRLRDASKQGLPPSWVEPELRSVPAYRRLLGELLAAEESGDAAAPMPCAAPRR